MRTWLGKTYEVVQGPSAPSWEAYETLVMNGWQALRARRQLDLASDDNYISPS